GCKYTSSFQTSEQYKDDGTLLTDGNISLDFDTETWAGYMRPGNFNIVLDLGSVKNDLADFSVHSLRLISYGIGSPATVQFEISTDGKNYQTIGTAYRSSALNSLGAFTYQLKLAETVSARYVRFSFTAGDSSWVFISELSVRSYLPDTEEVGLYYGDSTLPKVDPKDYWPKAEQNNTKKNLIAGKQPYIFSEEEIDFARATEYYNSIKALPLLTDGKFATRATYSDPALVHFTGAIGRTLTFDLGHTSAVSGVMLRFLKEDSSGVQPPQRIVVYVSVDGENWEKVYDGENSVQGTNIYQKKEISLKNTYKARFVRVYFTVSSHVFCDEIEVYGTTAIPENAKDPKATAEEEVEDLGYVMPEDFLGVHNVLLSYNCLPEDGKHSEAGLITVEEYLPHVGYYDESGKLVDTFFDGFLYLPYTSFNYSDYAKSFEGWQFYVDDIYAEGRNMDALNQAVGIVGDELNLTDYKCTVFTSILYTFKTLESGAVNSFGDIDGDGVKDSFSSIENRKKAIKWIIDQEYQRFLAGGYDNLEFGGFYWFEEFLSLGDPAEKELTLYASNYVHSLGLKLFWIPWYCASGYDKWQEYGFDVACMQPNYMFGNKGNPDVLRLTAEKTKHLGMCVEIEMNSVNNAADVQRYMEYLAAGAEYGYMDAVKMYYQGGVPGAFHAAYLSEDPFKRAVYDMTYLFAKEKFTAEPPTYTVGDVDFTGKNGSVSGSFSPSADKAFYVELAVSPTHGDLCLNSDGSFIYYARDGFTGTDRFALQLNFGYAVTQEIVITVTVE
ncbi:MAG: DUF4855 domain-containing protein, partial [Clostridia bacterium]|nr:DUF4855 domain-containing protein [Clostridia bacterium]